MKVRPEWIDSNMDSLSEARILTDMPSRSTGEGSVEAEAFGFSPDNNGTANAEALQRALDKRGTITVTQPGTYRLASTVLIGSDTAIRFGNGVSIQKVNENGPFTHVILNRGALTRTWDRNITVEGLHIRVNGLDHAMTEVYGLRGQLAFFYVKDLRIERFRCLDLGKAQFAIHVCTFEDIIIDDVIVHGDKDGVHLGRGRRFTIRNGVFKTFDDAVALNGHDYASGNPELGWIEDGVVENCHDLPDDKEPIGFFCRILAGAWIDWRPGMEVQNSDSVVSHGRLYRVQARPDGTTWKSLTQPTHENGAEVLDGINWGVVQADAVYAAGVRNVTFRDIFLGKPRIAVSIHFDNDRYSRSYYPGAKIPMQEQISLDRVRVLHDQSVDLVSIDTPVDVLTFNQSTIRQNRIHFLPKSALLDHGKTWINFVGCIFGDPGPVNLVTNEVPGKKILLRTTASVPLAEGWIASVDPGEGTIEVESDLPGLKPE